MTNDIALGVRTSIDVAERLKLDYSQLSLPDDKKIERQISLNSINKTEDAEVSNLYLSKIVTARYEEILMFVRDELKIV